jgi:predicted XRE-type DNA-binding protein
MSKEENDTEVTVGSGNIFEDLGYANPEEAQAKAELARQIHQIIKNRKLTQKQAAAIMKIDQPKVSDIIRGKLSKYTLDRLIRFLTLLGRDIEIHVRRHTKKTEPAGIHVFGIEKPKNQPKRPSAS